MTANTRRATLGATVGDMLIFLSTLSVAAALLYPAWSGRGFRARVDSAIADVETLAAASRSVRDNGDRWPTPAAPGVAPPELQGLGAEGGVFSRLDYTLAWSSWEVVDSVEAPPDSDEPSADDAPSDAVAVRMQPIVRRVGAIALHAGDESLLAELLDRYSDESSFVLDTIWLLVLPERAVAPAPRP